MMRNCWPPNVFRGLDLEPLIRGAYKSELMGGSIINVSDNPKLEGVVPERVLDYIRGLPEYDPKFSIFIQLREHTACI